MIGITQSIHRIIANNMQVNEGDELIPHCRLVRNTGTSCNAVRCFERFNHYSLGTPFTLARYWPKFDGMSQWKLSETNLYNVYDFSDPQSDKAPEKPEAAICVQYSSARRVLQFTLIIAFSCDLHRQASRVIHRL